MVMRGSAPCSKVGGEGQPDNKSPMRAMASGDLFSASEEGGAQLSYGPSHLSPLLSPSPGLPSAIPRFCALHSLSSVLRNEINRFSSCNSAPGLGASQLSDPGGRHKETSRKPASQTC